MLASQGRTSPTRESIIDVGPGQVTAEKEHAIWLPPHFGVVAVGPGVVRVVVGARRSECRCDRPASEDLLMLYYALVFLIVGLVAGVLGLVGIAAIAGQIAWILFVIGIVLLVLHLLTGRRVPPVV